MPDGSFIKESPERGVGKICDTRSDTLGAIGAWRKFEPDTFTDEEVEKFELEWRATHPGGQIFGTPSTALRGLRCASAAASCNAAALLSNAPAHLLQLKLPSSREFSLSKPTH